MVEDDDNDAGMSRGDIHKEIAYTVLMQIVIKGPYRSLFTSEPIILFF